MSLPIAATIADVRDAVAKTRARGERIGLVPTMGALHEGHAALVRAARRTTDFVVVSIFVNPTQFGPKEDFTRYPRTLEADSRLIEECGGRLIFAPTAAEMYPEGFATFVEVPTLQETLCGASRPGHFRGVCTVVLKLLNIVMPDVAVFGAKDYQQSRIIQRMVRDLNVPVTIQVEPTIREPNGLAMSSRNRYLTAEERMAAAGIYRSLQSIRELVSKGANDVRRLETELRDALSGIPGARIDYASIVDADSLAPIDVIARPAVAAVAVFLGTTRLIDNLLLN